jgi:hypothetical protein
MVVVILPIRGYPMMIFGLRRVGILRKTPRQVIGNDRGGGYIF